MRFVFILLLFIATPAMAQKAMTFQQAAERKIPFQHLDSIYKSAVHSEPEKAVFKTEAEQAKLQQAYGKMLQDFGVFLKKNHFTWEKPTRCFNRIYFRPDGKIDYFLYNFLSEISPEKQQQFEKLLGKFIKKYKFGLRAKEKFAQCSPVTYQDPG